MIEVLKQARKAFEVATTPLAKDRQEVLEAVAAINQAIAELESQEPVAFFDWYDSAIWGNEDFKQGCHRSWNAAIKYTPPAQRTWVGLTDEEIAQGYETTGHYQTLRPQDKFAVYALARAIEAKLKDKNT
jgi:hypothetical protein